MDEQRDYAEEMSRQEITERRRQMAAKRRENRIKQISILSGGVLALFVVIIFLVNLIVPDNDFSANENRSLASFPSFSWQSLCDGSFGEGLQSYVSDQFFSRDGWISLKLTEDKIKGVKESNGVFLGKNGYLIEKPETPDMEYVQNNLKSISGFAERYPKLSMYSCIVPNAACVMSDCLPSGAPVRDQLADLAMLKKGMGDKVNFIDITEALKAHSDEGLYYKTDHHWTSLGAKYAFEAMAPELKIDKPIKEYDIYRISDSFEGTMASKSGCHGRYDTIETYTPKNSGVDFYVTYEDTFEKTCSLYKKAALEDKDQYTVFFGGNYPQITIKTTNNNNKVLLMFKDSYANCLVQFLTPYYEEIIMIDPRYYYEDAGTIISGEGVTDVLFLYNLNTYLGDTSLCDVLNSISKTSSAKAEG